MALGADSGTVTWLMLQRGLMLIGAGTVFGLGLAALLTKVLRSMLWGVTAMDPLTFLACAAVLAATGLLACYLPARRALAVEPTIALRHE